MNKKTLILTGSILIFVIFLIFAKPAISSSLTGLDEWSEPTMMWDGADTDSWLDGSSSWTQDLFGQGVFEGVIGRSICFDLPAGTTGGDNNIATGNDPASAAAWILAEQVQYWVTPTDPRYIYKIQFYVIAGTKDDAFDRDQVCEQLNFQIVKKIGGVESVFIENSLAPGTAWTFQALEGGVGITPLTALGTEILLATSTTNLLGQQICLKFVEPMIRQGCLQGVTPSGSGEGEEYVCSDIVLGEEYSYDYECSGAFCDAFLGFSGSDWEFTPAPATAAGAPTVATTTTDPATGLPTAVPIATLD